VFSLSAPSPLEKKKERERDMLFHHCDIERTFSKEGLVKKEGFQKEGKSGEEKKRKK